MLKTVRPTEPSINQILAEPLTNLRIFLTTAFRSEEGVTPDILQRVREELLKPGVVTQPHEIQTLKQEIGRMERAMAEGQIDEEPDLSYPSSQILWGSCLAYFAGDQSRMEAWPEDRRAGKISHTRLWNQIKNSSYLREEMRQHAMLVADNLRKGLS